MLAMLALAMLMALAVTACGSSASPSPGSSSALLGTPKKQDCADVGDVLSDGPDPDADPVGYAQAQILPLRHLTIADASPRRAVQALAAAYQAFSSSGGASASAKQVSTAGKAVNALCPGVAN
jgi:hypothetical protein